MFFEWLYITILILVVVFVFIYSTIFYEFRYRIHLNSRTIKALIRTMGLKVKDYNELEGRYREHRIVLLLICYRSIFYKNKLRVIIYFDSKKGKQVKKCFESETDIRIIEDIVLLDVPFFITLPETENIMSGINRTISKIDDCVEKKPSV